jgi:hypothetical protein
LINTRLPEYEWWSESCKSIFISWFGFEI